MYSLVKVSFDQTIYFRIYYHCNLPPFTYFALNMIYNRSFKTLFVGILMTGAACQSPSEETPERSAGIDLADMDTTVSPREDFYRFANGGWLDRTEIPADEGRWSSFNELRDNNNNVLLEVLENATASGKYDASSDQMKAAQFYEVGMDSTLAEQVGVEPLKPWLQKIDAAPDVKSLRSVLGELRMKGISPFFSMYVTTDRKKSDEMIMHVSQGGLGLPNRDYYTQSDSTSKAIKTQYVAFITDMLGYIGYEAPAAQQSAQAIMEFETALAEASMTNVERRDPVKTYNKYALAELDRQTPQFQWSAFFEQLDADPVDSVVVGQPAFLKKMDELLARQDLSVIKDYLKFNVINEAAAYLNHEVVNRNFEFYGKVIQGTDEMRPRWKRVLGDTDDAVGFAVGKLYVDDVFPPAAKDSAEQMVEYIKKSFANRIQQLPWMSDETKARAQEKLESFNVKIGYPDTWETYEDLTIGDSSYLANVYSANEYAMRDNLDKLGKPVDKEEWFMTPQTVNAYYSPTFNEIVFPAGILQPPFYDYRADAAVNFGGIGAVIGHEISHGFDDNGSRYDNKGNMNNWWTEEDRQKFDERTGQLAAQYDAYEPLDSVFVNGKFTLGENIGDLGGVLAAYDGLELYLEDQGRPENLQGFTPEQRFFISWATIWRTKAKDESIRNQVMTDPHSPGIYRATGPLTNVEGFYEAFNVSESDPMYKADSARVYIW